MSVVTKAAAVAAYDAACAVPTSADWRAVADMLRAALPGAKAVSDAPAWWADYALPKAYSTDSVDVLFADGETVRTNVFTARNKPPRIAATIRTAIAFYRARTGAETVPAIASVTRVSDRAEFDAATCSALTTALRSKDGARVEAQGARAITSESIARMTAELERRRGGLARLLADVEAARSETVPFVLASDARSRLEGERQNRIRRASDVPAWEAAIAAGLDELERMHAAYGAIEAAPVPVVEAAAPGGPLDEDETAAALAAAYGEPCEAEIVGTVEAEPIRDRAEPAPDSQGAVLAVGTALDAIPNNGLGDDSQPLATAYPVEAIAEPAADEWRPSVLTHPIVALCLSDKAREALEARVMDGTWPAAGRTAPGGAWRLTLEDARDCADIPSLRLVGMPRKPRRPRVALPVEAIAPRPPVEAIRTAPPAYMVPGAGLCGAAVTYHAAPTA